MNPGKRINSLVVFLVQLQSFLSELAVLVANRSKRSFYSRSFDKNFGITNVFDFYELLLQLQLNAIWRSDWRFGGQIPGFENDEKCWILNCPTAKPHCVTGKV